MVTSEFQFVFSGENAAEDAAEFRRFLETEFPDWAVSRNESASQSAKTGAVKTIDQMDMATLALAIPSAILATWDLAMRLQLNRKMDKLLEQLRAFDRVPVVVVPDGAAVPAPNLSPDQMLDSLAVASQESQVRW